MDLRPSLGFLEQPRRRHKQPQRHPGPSVSTPLVESWDLEPSAQMQRATRCGVEKRGRVAVREGGEEDGLGGVR